MQEKKTVYPYIPNSSPEIKKEMLAALGVRDVMNFTRTSPSRFD